MRPLVTAIVCGILLGAATGAPGCNGSSIGGNNNTTDDAGTGGGTDDSGTGGGGGNDFAGQAGYCAGSGPPILVGDTSGSTSRCTGNIAASAFRYGLCMCQGLSANAAVVIDAFDSSRPGVQTQGTGGSLGANAGINAPQLSVGGTLQVGTDVNVNGSLTVGQDALVGATLVAGPPVTIKRNAQVASDVKVSGALTITGSLTYPNGKTLMTGSQTIGGGIIRNAVSVPAPCDCGAGKTFDIATYVQQRQNSNDNAAIGLDAGQLNNYSGDQTLNLTCGRFYIDRINGNGKLTVNVGGRTALFIGGDVNLSNSFTVNLSPNGELDLFLNGALTSSAPLNFGNKDAPARVRLYMGGQRNINLTSGSVLGGNLYAPDSALVAAGTLEVFGAVFVNNVNNSAALTIHHDIAVLNASQECNPTGSGGGTTGPACQKCGDCGGQACVNNKCGSCTTSADCCAPLSCKVGKCVYEVG